MLLTRMRLLSHRYGCLNGVRYLNTRVEDQVLPTSTATTTTRRKKKKIQHHATAMTIVMLGSGGSNSFRNGRKQPCLAVNLPYGARTWIFDAGETSLMDHHPNVKDHDVRRVFLTHLHGDHMFGLPGLMSRINLHEKEALEKHKFIGQEEPFEIIGPHGVGRFVRTAISISKTRLKYKWRIVELRHGEPAKGSPDDVDLNTTLLDNEMPMEIVYPDSSILDLEKRYVWRLPGKDLDETGSVKDFDVTACEIKHTKSMPSIGYVLQEPTLPRNLVIEKVRHHLELNRDWIEETYGKERARKMKEAIKSPNFRLELPSGVVMDASDPDSEFFGPIRRGRKICVLGDTRDAGNISSEAHGADLLVHECTYLDHQNKNAKMRGHSTPSMAGAFAKSIEAKRLVLNHAGSIIAPYNKKLCQSVVSSAQRAMGAKKNSVWLSSDDDVYSLPVPKD